MNLFINWFETKDPVRQAEYQFCYDKNFSNGLFKNIINLQCGEEQPTYNRFFELMKQYPDDINVLANLDIYFDRTLELAAKITTREAWCLTRWEYVTREDFPHLFTDLDGDEKVVFFEERNTQAPPAYAQDVWIVRGAPRIINADFSMGMPGCDNRIAWCFHSAGYIVRNPCLSMKCIHVHASNWRDQTKILNSVPKPYLKVTPERL